MENFKINNINTTLIKTNKFKTVTVIVAFFGEFSLDTATKKSLLCNVLANTTKNYNTKKMLANKLFDLYGASVSVSCMPIYKTCITVFSMEVVNSKYTSNPNLLKEAFDFLYEIIYNPNIVNNQFDSKVFNEEKLILTNSIKNIYNNKARYALKRMLEIMGPNEIFSVASQGDLQELAKIDEYNLFSCYKNMIDNEEARFFVIGDLDIDLCTNYFNNFKFNNNIKQHEVVEIENKEIKEIREREEKQNLKQSKLVIGLRTKINSIDELYVPLVVLNMMLGGMFSSDLFRVIREENSLAYSISSRVFFDTKIMIISAGIDAKNYELTKSLIFKELNRYKNGDIKEELLKMAKDNLISSLLEVVDDPYEHLAFTLKNSLLKKISISELNDLIKKVKIEDIVTTANMLEVDTIFLLRGE